MRESLKLELFRTPWHRLHISDSPISYLKKLMNLCFRHVIFTLLGSHDLYLFMNVYIQRRTNWTSIEAFNTLSEVVPSLLWQHGNYHLSKFVMDRKQSENPATFSSGSRKKWNWNITNVIDGFPLSWYQCIFNFLQISEKLTKKNQQKSLASRARITQCIASRSLELPMKPFGIRKTKMAAKFVLLTVVIALLFQSMPAKMEKSFDKFLKSDHTNNWAVLVREKNIKR